MTPNNTIVTVTGGSGYLASHIVQQLLENGYSVRATVRKIASASSKHLTKEHLCPNGCPGSLELFEGDLGKPGSFDAAMDGAKYVLHTASPFLITHGKDDPQKHLVDPAVNGTMNVLNSCNKATSVERVVLTSSCAAIQTNANDKGEGYTYTEEDWNDVANLQESAYQLSKTMAERKAWDMAKDASWDLVVINPGMIFGPTLSGRSNDGTIAFLKNLVNGAMYVAIDLSMGCVDVRDVAKAHILGFELPKASGRHICINKVLDLKEMGACIQTKYQKYWTPTYFMPKWLARILGPLGGISKDFVDNNAGIRLKLDNNKIKNEMNFQFRDMNETFADSIESMIKWNIEHRWWPAFSAIGRTQHRPPSDSE